MDDTYEIIQRVVMGPGLHTVLQKKGPGGLEEAKQALAKYNPQGLPVHSWTSMSGMETTLSFKSRVVARVFHEEARVRHMAIIEARCAEARAEEARQAATPYDSYDIPRKDPKDIWL